ncbi:MAG: hypothetical protein JXA25_15575 [Anaerolineales bacterium]|nr:hypothetical protein [Anaerolineales bacterium]
MKTTYFPYYTSRAVLSIIFSLLIAGFSWKAGLFTVVLFTGFLLYLHSGWFQVDKSNPYFPLRRDENGKEIQRKAIVAAVVVSILLYSVSPLLNGFLAMADISNGVILSLGVLIYFLSQAVLFIRH